MTSVEHSGNLGNQQVGAGPTITVVDSYEVMSRRAADIVADTVGRHPACAITVPTGSTPLGMYQELIRRVDAGTLDLSRVQIFCLDEYLGTSPDDVASLTGWLQREFLVPARIPEENIHYIPATADDPDAAAERYEAEIRAAGGLELAVLGLGPNGHVAFNEPGSAPDSRTRVLDLTEESREQNAAYYENRAEIPAQAMTMGLGTILGARRLVLIVSGESKAGIVRQSLEGPMTLDVPGSWLQLAGEKLEVILDAEAASALGGRGQGARGADLT